MSEQEQPGRDGSRVEREVRPRAWALPIAERFGGGDYLRTLRPTTANEGSDLPWEPLYDKAALDAAVAEERRKWRALGGYRFAGWFRELPSGMSYRLWAQGGHEQGPHDTALYERA